MSKKSWFAIAAAALVVAIALIAISLLSKRSDYAPSSAIEPGQAVSLPRALAVEVDQLASATFRPGFKIRSLGPPNSGLFQEAKDAAINEFAHRIKLSDGRYNIEPAEDPANPDLVRIGGSVGATQRIVRLGGSVGVKLRMVDANGKLLKEFSAIDTLTNEPSGLQDWLISLPSTTLYRIDMDENSAETVWQPETDKELCVTFTYKLGDGYKAALGQFHDFENEKNP